MLLVLATLGSLVLVAAGITEKAGLAEPEGVEAAAAAGAKVLELPAGGNPENPKPEG